MSDIARARSRPRPPLAAGRSRPARVWLFLAAVLSAILTGCTATIPADPDGTLVAVTGGVLRVGVSAEPGLTETRGDEPAGPLVELTEEFAASVDADIRWTTGSEETLVGMLEQGRIDLAIGGFTDATPWADRVGITRGYPGIPGSEGRAIVLLLPLGENAYLSELERFLDAEAGS
ncbi:hypothetical protein [Microbacterium tumbae]